MAPSPGGDRKRNADLGPTPATCSYIDALLTGSMTEEELERVRGELFGALGMADAGLGPPPVSLVELTRFHAIEALLERNDCGGALLLAEEILAEHPDDTTAGHYVDMCRDLLCHTYLAHLAGGAGIVGLCVTAGELRALRLDRWSAYLVSCIDGTASVDDLVDLSAMPRLDALRVLYELTQRGITRVDPPRGR
jgi:hypothetical protein